jgi:hypothetical protein
MITGRWFVVPSLALVGALCAAALPAAEQAGEGAQDRLAALKQGMAASQKQLRQYEWIETTIVSLKGEERSRKQQRCYYGADGKLQKVPVESAAAPASGGGGRGGRRGGRLKQAVVENKKEEMQEYMERAAALIHEYIPPDAARIEQSRGAGKFTLRPGADGRVGLEFGDYLKPSDRLTVGLDPQANRLVALDVASYLDDRDDAVTLAVQFAALPDGTTYAAQSTLDAPAKNVRVVIQNSGYRPLAR